MPTQFIVFVGPDKVWMLQGCTLAIFYIACGTSPFEWDAFSNRLTCRGLLLRDCPSHEPHDQVVCWLVEPSIFESALSMSSKSSSSNKLHTNSPTCAAALSETEA